VFYDIRYVLNPEIIMKISISPQHDRNTKTDTKGRNYTYVSELN